ncbi:hypothetical protein ACNSOL_11990 (plasmid) [Aliarcobacter lanthieri]|uniref:hypothetical protein n=1 Tax=Aliarcobacter lanthieri TaxID=1355374 RepID=UPI003AAC2D0D
MIKSLLIIVFTFFLSGCLMIGKENFACENSEDLKDAGICGSSMHILKNKRSIEKESYQGFTKVRGTFIKCDNKECINKNEEREEVKERW